MNDQSRPEQPEDGQGTEHAGAEGPGTGAARDAAAQETPKKDTKKSDSDVRVVEQHGKSRQGYLDPRGSESTREMRDTARRRRDSEEKLQQHLNEAKDHVPNEHHEHLDEGGEAKSQ